MAAPDLRPEAMYEGVWFLQAWELFKNGELDCYPHDRDGEGRLMLSPNGMMSTFFQRQSWRDVDPGVKASWEKFIGFGGRWRLEGGTMFYHVEYASEPSWIGQVFERQVRIDGGKLIVETREATNRRGEVLVNRLTYARDERGGARPTGDAQEA